MKLDPEISKLKAIAKEAENISKKFTGNKMASYRLRKMINRAKNKGKGFWS